MFSRWVEDQQQPGEGDTEDNHTMTTHRVKGVEMFRVVPGTQCGCCYYC